MENEDLGVNGRNWNSEDLKEITAKYRQELVETAVEQDEKLMESY